MGTAGRRCIISATTGRLCRPCSVISVADAPFPWLYKSRPAVVSRPAANSRSDGFQGQEVHGSSAGHALATP
jgi:hypothetical protein